MASPTSASRRFLPDSNCIVAAVSPGHEHHDRATREVDRRLDEGEHIVLAAHSLAESYSVLTRLPVSLRLDPLSALAALKAGFIDDAVEMIALDGHDYLAVIESLVAQRIGGGQTYDALIVRCAVEAGVNTLLTFNERHFRALAPRGLEVVVPS